MYLLFIFVFFPTVFSVFHSRESVCEDEVRFQFDLFINYYNKIYSEEEKATRFEIFKKNILDINERNRQDSAYAINKFADLSHEEFSSRYTGHRTDLNTSSVCKIIRDDDLNFSHVPESFDWRDNITLNVKDQLHCNACWAFAATGSVEAQNALRYKRNIILSEQQLVDCVANNPGCQGGHPAFALRHLIQAGGQEPEESYPYFGEKQTCHEQWGKMAVRVTECFSFVLNSEDKIRHALVKYGPLTGAVDADSWIWYRRERVFNKCTFNRLDHSILIVGYGIDRVTGEQYWTIKNSWGEDWGDGGYIRLPRGVNACGIHNSDITSCTVL